MKTVLKGVGVAVLILVSMWVWSFASGLVSGNSDLSVVAGLGIFLVMFVGWTTLIVRYVRKFKVGSKGAQMGAVVPKEGARRIGGGLRS